MSSNPNSENRKKWNLLIGITLVIFGGLRLYGRFQETDPPTSRIVLTIGFIGYGVFLIYNHFSDQNSNKS